ncbi:MAG TPA: hypothetical protein VLL05_00970 [Terriglobales bacterium]|nr:hypothetical protein [Terriglobales bacterium]
MNETKELQSALEFVIARIEQEAVRSGETLNDEQRFLLNNLPKESALPKMDGTDPESPPLVSIPRDLAYERLIALAREARDRDLQANTAFGREWKLAYLVSKLHRPPMAWLLEWAGMKKPGPWWDRAALIATALLVISISLALIFVAEDKNGSPLRWVGVGAALAGMFLLLWFGSRHIEGWQLKRSIQKCREMRII